MSSLRSRENAVERVRGALREPQPGDFRSRSSAPPSLFAGQCIFGAGQRCPKSPGRSLAATIEAAAPQWRYVNPNDPSELDLRSEEHTSELQSHSDLVCRLLLEKKKHNNSRYEGRN